MVPPVSAPATNEYDPGLPLPEEIGAFHMSTMEHVPKSVRADWGALLLHLLRSERDFQLLWMAPKFILGPLKRVSPFNLKPRSSTLIQCSNRVEIKKGLVLHTQGLKK